MNIEITRLKRGIHVNVATPYLTKYLKYNHRSMEFINYKKKPVFTERLLHTPDGKGGLFTLQGFFEKVCELIHQAHDTYVVKDLRTPLPDIDWPAVKALNPRDYQIEPLVEFLTKGIDNSGVILAAGGWGKTYAQAFTYAAFNSLNTILAIPLKQVYTQTYQKFCALFPDKHIGRVGDGYNDISKDITLTTFRSLKKCAIEKCQLLLVDELQCSTGEQTQEILTSVSPIRIFGFTATDEGLFNGADKMLKGIYGERLIDIPYEDAQEAGAVVPGVAYFLKMPDNEMVTAASFDGALVQGIKKNKTRNSMIAKVCASVPDGWPTLTFIDHIKDHLKHLYPFMPAGTKYIHRETSKNSAFALSKKQQDETIAEFSNNEFQHLIATDAFRAGVDLPHLRVVVQAAGGSSKIEIIQEALRGSRVLPEERQKELGISTPKTHFVIIDFLDNHDERLHGMALKRKKYYEEQGWAVVEVDSVKDIDWNYTGEEQKQL